MVVAVSTVAVASMAAVVSMVAARCFTVAASVAVARRFVAAGFEPPMVFAAVVIAMADSRSGIITGTSFTTGVSSMDHPIITDRPIIITPTAVATPSGPITARAASVTIATRAITGIIAGITRGELRRIAETNQAPDGRLICICRK